MAPKATYFSASEDALLIDLKEVKNLGWKEISTHFPARTKGTLQVRYCRTLQHDRKERKRAFEHAKKPDVTTSSPRLKAAYRVTKTASPPASRQHLKRAVKNKVTFAGLLDDIGEEEDGAAGQRRAATASPPLKIKLTGLKKFADMDKADAAAQTGVKERGNTNMDVDVDANSFTNAPVTKTPVTNTNTSHNIQTEAAAERATTPPISPTLLKLLEIPADVTMNDPLLQRPVGRTLRDRLNSRKKKAGASKSRSSSSASPPKEVQPAMRRPQPQRAQNDPNASNPSKLTYSQNGQFHFTNYAPQATGSLLLRSPATTLTTRA